MTTKTDFELRQDVLDELDYEPSINAEHIGVTVQDGVVTLTGKVNSYSEKYAAEHAARRVSGVRALAEDIVVGLPAGWERSDTEIAQAALAALRWNTSVPETVQIKVEDGWLTLSGQVTWQFQREAAVKAVRDLIGVKGVTSLITLPAKQTVPTDAKERIEKELVRSVREDIEGIKVHSQDGKIVLEGEVRSWSESQDIERAAWAIPGVSAVENRLTLGNP